MNSILRFIVNHTPDCIGRMIIKHSGDMEFYVVNPANNMIISPPYESYADAKEAACDLIKKHGLKIVSIYARGIV